MHGTSVRQPRATVRNVAKGACSGGGTYAPTLHCRRADETGSSWPGCCVSRSACWPEGLTKPPRCISRWQLEVARGQRFMGHVRCRADRIAKYHSPALVTSAVHTLYHSWSLFSSCSLALHDGCAAHGDWQRWTRTNTMYSRG